MQLSTRIVSALALALAAASLSGCIVGGSSSTTQTGNYVSPAAVSMIEPGKTSKKWVQATLGDPTTKVTEDGRELWKYSFQRVTKSSGYVLVVFHGANRDEVTQTTFVEFDGETVKRVWQDPAERASTPSDVN
jgi:outer membrane protein assembly factor BamE (lipoprotein component of BamABCDE complex)